jgi:hypothetical protein
MCLNDYEKTVLREIRHLDLIKMDIEGSEVAAMRGMDDFVRRFNHPPIYAEMNSLGLFPQGETSLSFFQQGKKLGYVPYEIIGDWLYEYNIENFPDKIFRDFLFLREIPDFLKDKIRPQINQEENKITKYILDNLQAYVSDKERIIDGITIEQYAICICYSLKDYPNYFNKPEINDLLSIIAKEKPQPYFVGKAIEWYVS